MRLPVKSLASGDPTQTQVFMPPPTGLFPEDWQNVPAISVYLADLHFTRTAVDIGPLFGVKDERRAGADTYPHVVSWRGELFLIGDHTTVVHQALSGTRVMRMRVFTIDQT